MDEWFWDESVGAYFDTARDHETLLTRPRDITDNAVPAGTSLAIDLLLRLAEVFGDDARRQRAMRVLESVTEPLTRYAPAFGHMLGAADMAVHGAVEVAIAGDPAADDFRALADAVGSQYVPSLIRRRPTCAVSTCVRSRPAIQRRFRHNSSARHGRHLA